MFFYKWNIKIQQLFQESLLRDMWEEFKFAVNFRYWVLQKIDVFILCLFHSSLVISDCQKGGRQLGVPYNYVNERIHQKPVTGRLVTVAIKYRNHGFQILNTCHVPYRWYEMRNKKWAIAPNKPAQTERKERHSCNNSLPQQIGV